MLQIQYNFVHEDIRIEVIVCYKHIIEALVKLSNNGEFFKFTKG